MELFDDQIITVSSRIIDKHPVVYSDVHSIGTAVY